MAGWVKLVDEDLRNVANGFAGLDGSGVLPHEQGGLELDVSAFNGIVTISGGTTSAITDSSTNWDTAYTHSQVSTGNPHSINPNDLDALSATWDLGGTYAIQSSRTPTTDNDLAHKVYVDDEIAAAIAGFDWKDSVRCLADSNITLSGEQTIDGVTTSTDRVLVIGQSTASQNGIYVSAAGAWSRAPDLPTDASAANATVPVEEGTNFKNTTYLCTNDVGSDVVGTDGLTFTQVFGPGTYTGATNQIDISAGNEISISDSFVGKSSITTLGTIATGTWEATDVGPTHGGTGLSAFSSGDVLYASGANTWAAAAPGATSGVQSHSTDLDTYASNPLTAGELGELQNIGTTTIDATQWGYVGAFDQGLTTTSSVSFDDVTMTGDHTITPTTLNISGGAVTVDRSRHIIAVETGTTDDLATINGGQTGMMLYISADPTGPDIVTLKHGTGNITTSSASDIAMGSDDLIILSYDGTNWLVTDWSGTVTAHAIGGASHSADTNLNTAALISDMSGLFVGTTDSQTLTNKTLTSPVVGTDFVLDGSTADATVTWTDFAGAYDYTVIDAGGNAEFLMTAGAQTMTDKTLTSPVLTTPQINDTSANHQYVFAVSELAADRTVTLPLLTGADTFVFNDFAATLTNKTVDSANNTLTVDLSEATVTGTTSEWNAANSDGDFATLAGTETLTNKTIDGANNTVSGLEHGSEVDNPSSGVHGVTGNVVGTTDTQTLSAKTLTSPTIGTNFVLDGTTADATVTWTDFGGAYNYTVIDAGGSAEFLMTAGSQTMTDKTLTSPDINTPDIDGGTVDAVTSLTPGANWDLGATYYAVGRYGIAPTTTAGRPGSPVNYELNFTTDGAVGPTTGPGIYVYKP